MYWTHLAEHKGVEYERVDYRFGICTLDVQESFSTKQESSKYNQLI
jgi:hypothetical protein